MCFLSMQDPMAELHKTINGSTAQHMIFHPSIYSERHLSSFNTILSGYTEDILKDVIIEMKVPRTWFLFSVPFVASAVKKWANYHTLFSENDPLISTHDTLYLLQIWPVVSGRLRYIVPYSCLYPISLWPYRPHRLQWHFFILKIVWGLPKLSL